MQDLLQAEQDLETLRRENSDLERALEVERAAKDDLEVKLEAADRDRRQLRKEADTLREELTAEKEGRATDDGVEMEQRLEGDERRLKELEETVRVKNKQIHQLLEDIEQVE